jgi:hypothetical protein
MKLPARYQRKRMSQTVDGMAAYTRQVQSTCGAYGTVRADMTTSHARQGGYFTSQPLYNFNGATAFVEALYLIACGLIHHTPINIRLIVCDYNNARRL